MSDVRLAVIGAGHLGKIHARLAQRAPGATLAVVAEPSPETGRAAAAPAGATWVANWQEAADQFDAAVVAAPTSLHHRLGLELIQAGKHVLMEKPVCENSATASSLVAAARDANLVLQVGHVERFNPAFVAAAPIIDSPRFVEAAREGRFTGRSVDVGVVLDLMIHDIDLALSLINSPLQRVSAAGASVVGPHEDMAQAWLEFANGAVVSLKASRVSSEAVREMKIIGPFAQACIDFGNRTAEVCRPTLTLAARRFRKQPPTPEFSATVQQQHLPVRMVSVPDDANPILEEQADFVRAIQTASAPRVTGEDGLRALSVAEEVMQCIEQRQDQARRQPRTMRVRAA